jgi:cell division protein FtsB
MPFEDCDPLTKRLRRDIALFATEDPEGFASWDGQDLPEPCIDLRRCCHEDMLEPPEKRLRIGASSSEAEGSSAEGSGVQESSGDAEEDSAAKGWAEAIVRELQGCPSVVEANSRCTQMLSEFEEVIRQQRLREADTQDAQEEQSKEERMQRLQHTNRVLLRAVHQLGKRCTRLEAGTDEMTALRTALEQTQEQVRRLTHSNEMLQGHLRVQMDGRNELEDCWAGALH